MKTILKIIPLLKMRYLTTIFLLLFVLNCCKKSNHYSIPDRDCSNKIFRANTGQIGDSLFDGVEILINTNDCGPNSTCPFTEIYACSKPSTLMTPPHSTFSIHIINSIPGTYYLGKLGIKRDSVNYYSGEAEYLIQHTPSISEGYTTDSLYNGILTITNKDEQNRRIYGTFTFTGRKMMTNDTILLSVTNGNFQGCY